MVRRRAGWAAVANACAALDFLAPVNPAWASIQLAVDHRAGNGAAAVILGPLTPTTLHPYRIEETLMKYLLLSYTPIAEWDFSDSDTPSPEAPVAFALYEEFQAELMASGELVATQGLGHPSMSRTLRKQAGAVVVTDGPFAELKEVLASYAVIDCSGYDRALEIGRQVVAAIGDTVEIRPITDVDFGESPAQA
jgi:hypothetical protein